MTPEQIANHPVHAALDQLGAISGWPEIIELQAGSAEDWNLQRIYQFVTLVRQRIETTPAALTSLASLNTLNGALERAISELGAFRSNKNVGHITNAVDSLDNAGFAALASLPITGQPTDQVILGRIADEYLARTQQILAGLEGDRDRLSKQNATLVEQLTQQATLIASLTETVAQQKTEAQQTNAEVKRDYAIVETDLRKQFQESVEKQTSEHAAMVVAQKEQFETLRTSTETTANDFVKQLGEKRDKAAEIVQIVGNIGVTGNYRRIAVQEGETADTWRNWTLVVLLGAAAFGAFTLWEYGQAVANWQAALIRMVFAFVIASIALYTGRESARHRTNSDTARQVELELASLGPYMESLTPEKRNEIRDRLIERYFGRTSEPHTVDPVLSPKLIERLVEAVKEHIGKKG